MAEVWKSQPKDVLRAWIDAIDDESEELTEWEVNFINSIDAQLLHSGSLSQKQQEILEKIYVRYTK
jgi:uncharacterized membrane-anchored protein